MTLKSREKFKFKHLPSLLKDTYVAWNNDEPFRLSAIVAYFAVLSMPAFLVIIINTVGAIWGNELVQGKLHDQIASAMGHETADSIGKFIQNSQQENKSLFQTIVGIITLLVGATGVFYHLQVSLNQVWEIKMKEDTGWQKLLLDRLRGFGFILVIGFLLLSSFIVSALLSAFTDYLQQIFPSLVVAFSYGIDIVINLTVISVLFAIMFKFLPDVEIRWKTVWIGGIITAVLFLIGKYILSLYFAKLEPGSSYGAAGSIILVLLWVSYTCLILFFGAEFTWVYAQRYGHGIMASDYAVRFKRQDVEVDDEAPDEPDESEIRSEKEKKIEEKEDKETKEG